jgi:translocation and assembly module TamB
VRVDSPGIHLGLFQPLTEVITGLSGRGEFNLHVTGPAGAPAVTGRAAIVDGSFTVPYTGLTYRRLQAAIAVSGRQLTVETFTLEDDDRHVVSVVGGVDLAAGGAASAFDLYVSGTGVHVLKNHLGDVAVSLDLHASGDLRMPLVVGTIDIDHATVEVDDILDEIRAKGYVPMPGDEPAAGAAPAAGGPLARASYSMTLAFPDSVVLRGRDLRASSGPIGLGAINITVGGALSVSKDPGAATRIRGALDVVRGQYEFQGRRFAIARGSTLSFGGDTVLDPALDVTAERLISGVTARVRVTGTARRPEVALSSTPALDESDILSLIVFNRPTNELLAGQRVSLAATAGTLAARAVATPLADSVARALDLDLFEIRPSDEVEGGVAVAIEEQIGERLFIGFRHEFGPAEVSQISFEYRLTELLRVVTTFSDGAGRSGVVPRAERAGIDLFYVIRR